jgi:hypothetical protein
MQQTRVLAQVRVQSNMRCNEIDVCLSFCDHVHVTTQSAIVREELAYRDEMGGISSRH